MKDLVDGIQKMVTEKADQKYINAAMLDLLAAMAQQIEQQADEIKLLKEKGGSSGQGSSGLNIG